MAEGRTRLPPARETEAGFENGPDVGARARPPGAARDDAAIRSAFGFDLPDDQWLGVLRESKTVQTMGRLGPFRLLQELGRGGQGTVYKALRDGDDEPVALKRLPVVGASADAAARFEREREAIAMLSHPCIVSIRGMEVIEGQSILAMEFVAGRPIDQWASDLPERPVEPILTAFLKVCDAVAHAHRRGVLHRDLKPSNILIDELSQPRVLDFGLAKLTEPVEPRTAGTPNPRAGDPSKLDTFVTRASGFVGTPAYAAPEQLGGDTRQVDTRSDVYSLGVLLYTLLCGHAPIDAKVALPELFDQIRRGISRPPSAVRPGLGRELDAIVLKAAALEPSRRYASVDDFGADLRRYLAGQTVLAHPPTAAYKLSKLWQRHRVIGPVLALAAIGVVVLSVVSTALAWNLWQQRNQLEVVSSSESRAREAAERALDESKKQSERHQAAAQFLSDMLNGVHEAHLEGQPLGSREMIDHAARRLEAGELANQPEVEAQLLYSVARAYWDLGHERAAEPFVARALDRSEKVFGPESYEAGRAHYLTGLVHERRRNLAASLASYERARAIVTATVGVEDLLGAQIDNNIGCVLKDLDRRDESEKLHRRTLAMRIKLRGGEMHYDVASSYRNLGHTLATVKRFDEAYAAINKSAELCERLFGPHNEKTINTRGYIARFQHMEGRRMEAFALRKELITAADQHVPEARPLHATLRRQAFVSARSLGLWEESIALGEQARQAALRLEQGALTAAECSSMLADSLLRLGRLDEAEARAREAVSGARATSEPRTDAIAASATKTLEAIIAARTPNAARTVPPAPAPDQPAPGGPERLPDSPENRRG